MVSQETRNKLVVGFGILLTLAGLILFVQTFFSAQEILELQFGPGELFTSLIGLGVMVVVSAFLVIRGVSMLKVD